MSLSAARLRPLPEAEQAEYECDDEGHSGLMMSPAVAHGLGELKSEQQQMREQLGQLEAKLDRVLEQLAATPAVVTPRLSSAIL